MFSVIYFTIPFGQNDSQQGKVKYNLNKNNENTKHKYIFQEKIYMIQKSDYIMYILYHWYHFLQTDLFSILT